MKQQVCVGGFIQNKSGEFLVVKRSDADEFLPGMWELPGGGIDPNESPQKGLEREIKEEVGLSVSISKPLTVHTYIMGNEKEAINRVEITFLCFLQKNMSVTLSFEHSEYQWITREMINTFAFSNYMRAVINDCLSVK